MIKKLTVGLVAIILVSLGLYQYSMDKSPQESEQYIHSIKFQNENIIRCLINKGLSKKQADAILYQNITLNQFKKISTQLVNEKSISAVQKKIIDRFIHNRIDAACTFFTYLFCFPTILDFADTQVFLQHLIENVFLLMKTYFEVDLLDYEINELDAIEEQISMQEQISIWFLAIFKKLLNLSMHESTRKKIIDDLVMYAVQSLTMYQVEGSIVEFPLFRRTRYESNMDHFYYSLGKDISTVVWIQEIFNDLIKIKKYEYARSFNHGLRSRLASAHRRTQINLLTSLINSFDLALIKKGVGPSLL